MQFSEDWRLKKIVIEKFGLRAYLSFEASQRKSQNNSLLGLKENYSFSKNNSEDQLVKWIYVNTYLVYL